MSYIHYDLKNNHEIQYIVVKLGEGRNRGKNTCERGKIRGRESQAEGKGDKKYWRHRRSGGSDGIETGDFLSSCKRKNGKTQSWILQLNWNDNGRIYRCWKSISRTLRGIC